MRPDFCHIHVHSDFSILDGFGTVKEYTEKAAKNNMKYLVITDHGMGAAYPRMIEECSKYNLKPVFGCEIYTNDYNHLIKSYKDLDEDMKDKVRKSEHLLLLAKNQIGYKNLVNLISKAWVDGFYYKPRVSLQEVFEHSEGLICCSACLASRLSRLIMDDKLQEAEDLARKFHEVWPNDYYIELQMNLVPEQRDVNTKLIRIAEKLHVPLVLTNDVHYCEKEDSTYQQYQLIINSKGTINNPKGLEFHSKEFWYKTKDELDDMWEREYQDNIPESEYKESLINTVNICEKCDVEIDTSAKFPYVENAAEILMNKCISSLKRLGLYKNKTYQERLVKEYELIVGKGFESYFLICDDIIRWTEINDYSVGPGRGCFTEDNLVLTEKGHKLINEVEIGDLVLSHDKKFHEVLMKFEYEIDEEIIEIDTYNGKKIKCTLDHKIMVQGDWKEARNLSVGDKIDGEIKSCWVPLELKKSKIEKINRIHHKGKVYDLTVEGTHSYNIDGMFVHNSGGGSLICYLLGITQLDPIKHNLIFERFLSQSRGGKFAKLQFSKESEII